MKVGFISLVFMMLFAAPVFAEDTDAIFINYKIKIDRDENYEQMLEKNKEVFEQLKNENLFSNWTKPATDIPENAKDIYKKPAFSANVDKHNEKTDYIRCDEITPTK